MSIDFAKEWAEFWARKLAEHTGSEPLDYGSVAPEFGRLMYELGKSNG